MKTKVEKIGDTLIVRIQGQLSYSIQEPLKDDLNKLMPRKNETDGTPKKIIFDLAQLDFVGSSGISSFVKTLKEFNSNSEIKPRYCHVKSEFRKIIKAFDNENAFEFFDSEEKARKSFDN